MKPITKIFLILIFIASASFVAKAQPHFTVNWTSNCEVQSHDSYYKVEWALIYLPTQSVLKQGISDTIPLTENTWSHDIQDWECNIDDYPLKYILVVTVKRYQDDGTTITCAGEARSSYLRCSDLYDGVTLTVNMTYP